MNSRPKHIRKWIIALVIVAALLVLLPGVIGQLVNSQLNQQLAAQADTHQSPQWQRGWWQSSVRSKLSTTSRVQLQFEHGPLWLTPLGAGLVRWQGELAYHNAPRLPLGGELNLRGQHQTRITVPIAFYLQDTGSWHSSQVNSNAYLAWHGSLTSDQAELKAVHPQGLLRSPAWQLSWQDATGQLLLTDPANPLQGGNLSINMNALCWQPELALSAQDIVHNLAFGLDWPTDQDITLQLTAGQISFRGQSEPAGALRLQARARSIDRIGLLQWLQTRQQPEQRTASVLAIASMLAAQPELDIEQFQFITPAGTIELDAALKFRPNQSQARLRGHLPQTAAYWLAQALMGDAQAARQQVQALLQDGWLQRDGEQFKVDVVVNL